MDTLLKEVSYIYKSTQSLRAVAKHFNVTQQKARKLVITADAGYTSNLYVKICFLIEQNKSPYDIAKIVNRSPNLINSYIPYTKTIYNYKLSDNAKRIKKFREKKRRQHETL